MRTLVDIPGDKLARLDAIARKRKWSRAEAVRQGVDRLISEDRAALDSALDASFGTWAGLGIDGLEFQRKLRAEWDDDQPPADIQPA